MSSRYIFLRTFIVTVVISLAVIFLFVALRLKMPADYYFKRRHWKKLYKEARSGDVIAVAYQSKHAKLVKVFTGSNWSHSAIIIKPQEKRDQNPSTAYVLEVARYSAEARGIMVTKLKSWLKRNAHHIVSISQYLGPEIKDEQIQHFLVRHEGLKEQMFVVDWLAAMVKTRYPVRGIRTDRKFFCSELVAHFMQEMGILKRKYHPSGYKPWELLYGDLPLKHKCQYRKPYLVYYNGEREQ